MKKTLKKEKCIQSWHDLYPNHQRRRDKERAKLTGYREFIKTLSDRIISEDLENKTLVTSSMDRTFNILIADSEAICISIELLKEERSIKIVPIIHDHKLDSIGPFGYDIGVDTAIKLIQENIREQNQ